MAKKCHKVRLAHCGERPIQLRYVDPSTGREVRSSTGTYDEVDAERQRAELEAQLLLGISRPGKGQAKLVGPLMTWEAFRAEYYELHLKTLRPRSIQDADNVLDIAEKILKPRVLSDVADRDALHKLQAKLLEGAVSRYGGPRSPHTVKSYMSSFIAALNWAYEQGWLPAVPRIRKVKTSKLKAMKGRPIAGEEFERMLEKTATVVGEEAAPAWTYLLRGLWASALRLDELMHVSWDDPTYIMPHWRKGRLPVLRIPATMQKNVTEEEIPLLPWFEAMLLETPEADRNGWAFRPASLNARLGRKPRVERPSAEWVGKVIGDIGEAAGVIVEPARGVPPPAEPVAKGKKPKPPRRSKGYIPAKYASAHDLRRSCAERLEAAGVPLEVVSRILRHASTETTRRHYAPGNVQRDAGLLQDLLGRGPSTPQNDGSRTNRPTVSTVR